MNTITKGLVGTVAAGAMAMAAASPAMARDRGGVDAGDVIAGALVIGGIAAVVAAASNDRGRYDRGYGYDDRYRGGRGGYRDNPREAVEQCVNIAERQASRVSWGGRADVTDIRDIKRTSTGYTIKGRIAVNNNNRGWRSGDRRYGNGWGNDYRGWNDRVAGYDAGKFTCKIRYGQVHDIDFSGIRGL